MDFTLSAAHRRAVAGGNANCASAVDAVTETERRLREAQAVAHVGSWHWDPASGEVIWSDELYRIFGVDPAIFTPTLDSYLALLHPDDRDANLAAIKATLGTGEPWEREFRIVRPDGEVRWLSTRALTERNGAGATTGMHGTCTDVTARREAEDRYRAVSELITDVSFAFHIDATGETVVDWVTDGHERLTGFSVEETDIAGWRSLIHPLDRADYEQRLARLGEGEADESEVRLIRKDGEIRWARITIRREASATGLPRYVGAVEDLTEQRLAERQLQESEERYRAVSQLTSDVAYAYHVDGDGKFVIDWVTDGLERICGYTTEEAVAMSGWRGMVVPEDRDRYERRLDTLLGGKSVTAEFRIRAKSGEIRWMEISARPQRNADGTLRVFGAARDVTDRNRFEEALAGREAALREAQAIGRMGHFRRDVRSGAIEWAEELHRIFGFHPVGSPVDYERVLQAVHPDDRGAFRRTLDGTREHDDRVECVYRVVRPDGDVRWVHTRSRLERDAFGRVIAVSGVSQDVTDRRQAEDLHRVVSEMVSDTVYSYRVVDGRMVLEWVTSAFERLTGHAIGSPLPEELFRPVVHPDDVEIIERAESVVLDGRFHLAEIRVLTPDMETRWLRLYAQPVIDEMTGRVVRVYGAAQNVTAEHQWEDALRDAYERERDAAERLREVNRMQDEFLSTASHELRTPLTALVGFASALCRDDLDPDVRTDVTRRLERNALTLGVMVERLLDFSRLASGSVRIETGPVNVQDVVTRTFEILGPDLEHRLVTVAVEPDFVAAADPAGLIHVLSNLMSNALKYTPEGSGIRITAERLEASLLVTVADDGPGMSAEVAARAFERFFRGPDQPSGGRGTGLGLAIARTYVELMGGEMWMDTEPGRGTRVSFTLPTVQDSVQEEAEREPVAPR